MLTRAAGLAALIGFARPEGNPCTAHCLCNDGDTQWDLSEISGTKVGSGGPWAYYVNICGDVSPVSALCLDAVGVPELAQAYRENGEFCHQLGQPFAEPAGRAILEKIDGGARLTLSAQSGSSGAERSLTLDLICDPEAVGTGTLAYDTGSPADDPEFEWSNAAVCESQPIPEPEPGPEEPDPEPEPASEPWSVPSWVVIGGGVGGGLAVAGLGCGFAAPKMHRAIVSGRFQGDSAVSEHDAHYDPDALPLLYDRRQQKNKQKKKSKATKKSRAVPSRRGAYESLPDVPSDGSSAISEWVRRERPWALVEKSKQNKKSKPLPLADADGSHQPEAHRP